MTLRSHPSRNGVQADLGPHIVDSASEDRDAQIRAVNQDSR